MDILAVANHIAPGCIERLALTKEACTEGFDWVGYEGVYVVARPGAKLPTKAELAAGEKAYNDFVAQAKVEAEAAERDRKVREALVLEADPLFFKEQAGEVPAGTWKAKRDEIKARFAV